MTIARFGKPLFANLHHHVHALAGPPLHSGGPKKLYQLAGVGVHQLHALGHVVLLWTPSCILSRMSRLLS